MDIIPQKHCIKCNHDLPATSEFFNRMSKAKDGLYPYCRACQRANDKGRDKTAEHARKLARKNMLASGYKQCSICKEVKPLSDYYKGKTHTGVHAACKDCYAVSMGWQRQPRKQFPPAPEGFKYCRKCDELKRLDQFYKVGLKTNRDGLSSWCSGCDIKDAERHRIRKGVKVRDKVPDGMKRCVICKKVVPRTEQYFHRSGNHFQSKCIECVSVYRVSYDRRNRHKKVIAFHRRRAREIGLPATLTSKQWLDCLEYFNGCCAACGRPAGLWHVLAQDHWIPINAEGNNPGTVARNIIPLCHARHDGWGGCNNSKSDRDPVEWLEWKFGKRKAKSILKRIQSYFDSLS